MTNYLVSLQVSTPVCFTNETHEGTITAISTRPDSTRGNPICAKLTIQICLQIAMNMHRPTSINAFGVNGTENDAMEWCRSRTPQIVMLHVFPDYCTANLEYTITVHFYNLSRCRKEVAGNAIRRHSVLSLAAAVQSSVVDTAALEGEDTAVESLPPMTTFLLSSRPLILPIMEKRARVNRTQD